MATDLMFPADADADEVEDRYDPARSRPADTRFALCRVSSIEWVIVDTTLPPANPSRVIGCIYEFDRLEYGVVWLGELQLRDVYGSPQDALDDAHRAMAAEPHSRSEPPIRIRHHPPVSGG